MDDHDIIEAYFARSEEAIVKTADQYGDYCFAIAYRILCDEADASECVNDAYLRVWDSIPPQRPRSLRLFLGAIVRNLSLNMYERGHAQKRGGGQVKLALEELEGCLPSADMTQALTDDIVIRDCLKRFLQALPTKQRWVFMRRYWNMDTVRDIADAMGTSEDHVGVMLSRARKRLKEMLRKDGIHI